MEEQYPCMEEQYPCMEEQRELVKALFFKAYRVVKKIN
jgi:hypothetical protein